MKELSASTTNGKIKDKTGPILTNGKVQLIFWGDWNDPTINPSKERIENAAKNILSSEYFSKLNQYRNIQKPTYFGSVMNKSTNLPHEIKDKDIEKVIGACIDDGSVPDFRTFDDGQIMYMLIPTPKHRVHDVGYAYHYNFKYQENEDGVYAIYYGYKNEERTIEKLSIALAHEIAEMCTNPIDEDEGFEGSEDDEDNEIADLCEDKGTGLVNGEIVEGYWSNEDKACVIPGKQAG